MRILFAGIIARYPFGGVTWCSLMYLLGLRALGHEVFYIEDTGECVYDPVQNTRATDPVLRHHLHPRRARAVRPRRPLERSSTTTARYHGRSARDGAALTAPDADLFINLSGGSWFWRDEYARIPRKVFIDSDPAFTQLAIAKAEPWYVEFFQRFDSPVHVRLEHRHAGVAGADRRLHLAQDLAAGHARRLADRRSAAARPLHDGDDLADRELHRRRRQQGSGVRQVHRPAVADAAAASSSRSTARRQLLRAARLATLSTRWACRARRADYRDFIQRSKAEFGVAKHTYVATRSGWFSDRTECYLAAGRPALVQDTGWTRAPAVAATACSRSRTPDEALAGIDRINGRLRRATRAARVGDRARALRRARRCCRSLLERRARESLANRPRRAGRHDHSAAEVRIGRDDDVAPDRGARRARPRRHAVRHRRLEDDARRCTPSTRTATGTTSTCGRGSSTRC